MASRRSVLVGLGGLVAGGGALIGTGAFTTVEAQRTVNVETTGDASGFLGLAPAARTDDTSDGAPTSNVTGTPVAPPNEYVSAPGDGTVEIDLDGNTEGASGLNQNAVTTFRNLVKITNNGTQNVETLNLEFISSGSDDSNLNLADTFSFTASTDKAGTAEASDISNDSDILSTSADSDSTLKPGEAIHFGIQVDLINGGNSDGALPNDAAFNLEITAETSNTQ
jgi:hypothetical protein